MPERWRAFSQESLLPPEQRVPGGLACLLALGPDQLLVGTADGCLLLYSRTADARLELSARRSMGGGRKPVEELALVGATAVLALCDASVGMYAAHDGLQSLGALASSRGATALGVDSTSPSPHGCARACIGLRRRLQLYAWEGREYELIRSLELPHTPTALSWRGEHICVGHRGGYVAVRASEGAGGATVIVPIAHAAHAPCATHLPAAPYAPRPTSRRVDRPTWPKGGDGAGAAVDDGAADGDILLLLSTAEGRGAICTASGGMDDRPHLRWGAPAVRLLHVAPFCVALLGDGSVQATHSRSSLARAPSPRCSLRAAPASPRGRSPTRGRRCTASSTCPRGRNRAGATGPTSPTPYRRSLVTVTHPARAPSRSARARAATRCSSASRPQSGRAIRRAIRRSPLSTA